jgi:hypothetical protein
MLILKTGSRVLIHPRHHGSFTLANISILSPSTETTTLLAA